MQLENQVAIITGAASGIGRAAAVAFAREGARVAVADVDAAGGAATVANVTAAGGEAFFIHTDVASAASVRAMVEAVVSRWGRIDILYNNAAATTLCNHHDRPVHELDEAIWDKMIAICLTGAFLCSKYVLPVMMKERRGVILNTSSVTAMVGEPGFDSYTAAKGGVISLSRSMAVEYAPYGIRVNCLAPGYVITECQQDWYANDPEARRKAESYHLTRLGRAEDVAEFALFLASDRGSFFTGALLPIDGGFTASKGVESDGFVRARAEQAPPTGGGR